jgi:hypothetical protein
MQNNFILTDVMKTGYHSDLEDFVNMNSFKDQRFEMTGEYFTVHNYDIDSYDRRIAFVHRDKIGATHASHNPEFRVELEKRLALLQSQNFKIIYTSPWESEENIRNSDFYPPYSPGQMIWEGGVSWFWFYMYRKHKDNKFTFDHSNKKYDFLYLNKQPRAHRKKLYDKLSDKDILTKSLHTNWPERKLPAEYELPWAKDYPEYGMDQDIFEKPYNDTACSIVSETNDNDYNVFMTEKIWKPIIAQQFFVVHGNYLYLQKLREMGFRTFNNYFEEAYDLDKDPNTRINTIVNLCDRLRDAPWEDMYLHSKALRQHNFDHFFAADKLSLEINKTLNLFLEFADSG